MKRPQATVAHCAIALCALASCSSPAARAPESTATPLPAATATAIPRGDAIRFALVGPVTPQNVWALFDAPGYSYNNYAVQAQYWPRLFRLSIPEEQLVAEAASGMPTAVQRTGSLYTAAVPLRSDLTWSDGSPFGAEDVAFTINTALKFQLGFDWHDYYDPQSLDHVEASGPETVTFYFKKLPTVGVWQYGALQGPIVQEKYWTEKVAEAATLLPSADLATSIATAQDRISDLQARIDALYAQAATAQGATQREIQARLKREQGNLDEAMNSLDASQAQYDDAMEQARASLHAVTDTDEPHLGMWISTGAKRAMQPGDSIENTPNPAFEGVLPYFRRAVYVSYSTPQDALAGLDEGKVDVILDPADGTGAEDAGRVMVSPTRRLHFVALNARGGAFAQTVLRQALACVVDQAALQSKLGQATIALTSFVPAAETAWLSTDAHLPCEGLEVQARKEHAVEMLRAAGYAWERAPSAQSDGNGLKAPDGSAIPALQLLSSASDPEGQTAAAYVAQQAQSIGVPLTAKATSGDEIDYAAFSSGEFDAVLLGWTVSRYPGYLCDWFGASGVFQYGPGRAVSLCGELQATSELAGAQEKIGQIQSVLEQDVPMIPLYADTVRDSYRGVTYPFSSVLDGLTGNYGAPAAVMPVAP